MQGPASESEKEAIEESNYESALQLIGIIEGKIILFQDIKQDLGNLQQMRKNAMAPAPLCGDKVKEIKVKIINDITDFLDTGIHVQTCEQINNQQKKLVQVMQANYSRELLLDRQSGIIADLQSEIGQMKLQMSQMKLQMVQMRNDVESQKKALDERGEPEGLQGGKSVSSVSQSNPSCFSGHR